MKTAALLFTGNKMQTYLHECNIIAMVWTIFVCMVGIMVLKAYVYYRLQSYYLTPANFLVH
jgi:hypothetical protein